MSTRLHALVIAVAVAVAGCGGGSGRLVRSVPSSSAKTVGVYASSAYAPSESVAVGPELLTRAMRASGSFNEDDVRALAGPLAQALATMGPDERIIVRGAGKEIHIYARAGELTIVSFHDGHEVSRHTSALPRTDVAAVDPVEPKPEVKPEVKPVESEVQPEVKPDPKPVEPEVKPEPKPVEPEVKPDPKPIDPAVKPEPEVKPTKDKKPKKDTKGKKRLTETEVRAKLKELDRLRDKGLITEPEYQKKRKELLDQL